jgi:uroporphyrinogen-III synthase
MAAGQTGRDPAGGGTEPGPHSGDHGGEACEYQVYDLVPSGETLDTGRADAVLFTSASSFTTARWERQEGQTVAAIGRVTAQAMEARGVVPDVIGDGSLVGTLAALNLRGGEDAD